MSFDFNIILSFVGFLQREPKPRTQTKREETNDGLREPDQGVPLRRLFDRLFFGDFARFGMLHAANALQLRAEHRHVHEPRAEHVPGLSVLFVLIVRLVSRSSELLELLEQLYLRI